MKHLVFLFLVLVSLPMFFNGCVPSKPKEEVEVMPSERLIKKLEANRRKIKNFEGVGTLDINTSELNTNASFKISLQKPDSIYMEIYGPFGIDLAQTLVTDNNFSFYDAIHNILYKGRTNSDILKKIFKVNMTFADLMDAFVGAVNLTPRLSQEPKTYDINYDKYILTYVDSLSENKSRYTIDVKDLIISDFKLLTPNNDVVLESNYSKFKLINGNFVPYAIKVNQKAADQSINIEYRKIEINKKAVKIKLDIPEDAEVIQW
ncbi:MAG: DUF4292 domain-containing protein [Methanococcaceae archaeon]